VKKRAIGLAAILLVSVFGVMLPRIWGSGRSAYASELVPVGGNDAKDLLEAVLLGCEDARSRVSSGVGHITEYKWQLDANKKLLEVEKGYSVVFSGDKCRARVETVLLTNERVLPDDPNLVPIPLGVVRTQEIAYDDEVLVTYSPDQDAATISEGPGATLNGVRSLARMMATGGPDPARVAFGLPTHQTQGPVVKGRQVVDGVECVVVETVYEHTPEVGDGVSLIDTFWVSPEMGFATLRMQTKYYGGKFGAEGMLAASVTAQPRQRVDGSWCLSRMETEQYALDGESGQAYLYSRTVATLADDFETNAPVTADLFSIDIPSGTSVHNALIDAEYTVP